MSSCQELNTLLVEHPEYDVLELGRKQIKYDKNAPYPKEGLL